nr:TIGR02569 family protein [Nakamurella flavida]
MAAFGAVGGAAEQLPSGRQGAPFLFGDIVLSPAPDAAETSWVAGVLEHLHVPSVRLARPVRSSDGRWVVGGWAARRRVSGVPLPRYDDMLAVSSRLHQALADVTEPRFLRRGHTVGHWADQLAWGEVADDGRLPEGHGSALVAELASGRREVDLPAQLTHGDLFADVLFAGDAPPAVVDIAPHWRPASWASAVLAVDALTFGGASIDLVDEWAGRLPEWPQMLRRALIFRLGAQLIHPSPHVSVDPVSGRVSEMDASEALVHLLSVSEVLSPVLSASA